MHEQGKKELVDLFLSLNLPGTKEGESDGWAQTPKLSQKRLFFLLLCCIMHNVDQNSCCCSCILSGDASLTHFKVGKKNACAQKPLSDFLFDVSAKDFVEGKMQARQIDPGSKQNQIKIGLCYEMQDWDHDCLTNDGGQIEKFEQVNFLDRMSGKAKVCNLDQITENHLEMSQLMFVSWIVNNY